MSRFHNQDGHSLLLDSTDLQCGFPGHHLFSSILFMLLHCPFVPVVNHIPRNFLRDHSPMVVVLLCRSHNFLTRDNLLLTQGAYRKISRAPFSRDTNTKASVFESLLAHSNSHFWGIHTAFLLKMYLHTLQYIFISPKHLNRENAGRFIYQCIN